MYIKTDYKDEYLRYLQDGDYSANTVRNLRSDMNSLYVWLRALNFQVTIRNLYDEYQRHLIVNGTPLHTMNRKLSSLTKFIQWLNSQYPTPSSVPPTQSGTSNREALNRSRFISKSRTYSVRYMMYFLGLLVLTSIIIGSVLVFRVNDSSDITKNKGFLDIASYNTDYILQFELQFNSPISLLGKSNHKILFSFYPQNDQSHSIGYVECPFEDLVIPGGSSRLKVKLDSRCSPLPSQVHDKIARNEAILTDIYLNDRKMTASKILLTNQEVVNRELFDQGEMGDLLSKASKNDSLLPTGYISGDVLGFEVSSPSATLGESIPLAAFQHVSPLDEGDIVTIYNNEIIRALLSTEIMGVKSADRIITKGVAYVHVVDASNATINVGDYISTSTIPGYGQKASNKYDSIVGVALEPYTPGNSFLKVLITTH